jgi:hypothetical protein
MELLSEVKVFAKYTIQEAGKTRPRYKKNLIRKET